MRILFKKYIFPAFVFVLLTSFCYAQKGTVKGKIIGVDGPLHGATISAGTITVIADRSGEFSLVLNPGTYTLQITHAGYKRITQEIKVDAGSSISFQFTMILIDELEEVVVLGSRFFERGNLATPVPVDVISSRQLIQTAQISLTQMLQFTAPSLNASRQLVNEPVTLRGLNPDQVLILVNGKRYHNMSFLNWGGVRGILGRGAVSNDLNAIPFSAIEKIEILRDGASAQYGSDAIAGVINIQLKKSIDKTWAQLHTGQYYKNDGETISFGINRGFTFFKKGFLNLSGAYRFQNPTYRGGKYLGTVYKNYPLNATHADSIQTIAQDDSIVSAKIFDRNKVSSAGSSKHNGFGLSMNGGYSLNRQTELFWTAVVNHRTTVFTSGYALPKNVRLVNPELFPDGFKPRPSNHSNDIFAIVGATGETKNRWQWEYSSAYGSNGAKYYNKETNNASQYYTLGKNAPTSFYTGSLIYGQLTNNVQCLKRFTTMQRARLNFAFGAEWRLEHYRIKEGEEASWKNYDTRKQGGSGGLVLGPRDAIKENRSVSAAYFDMESEFENRFLIGVAGRYEYYSDFGDNLAGKLAARYKLSEKFSLRGSVSNGFRAPQSSATLL